MDLVINFMDFFNKIGKINDFFHKFLMTSYPVHFMEIVIDFMK